MLVDSELMHIKLLSILRCPDCHQDFKLKILKDGSTEDVIEEGLLSCGCGNAYPIINGIPRILPNAYEQNSLFLKKYCQYIQDQPYSPKVTFKRFNRLHGRTSASFGRQWLTFDVTDLDDDKAVFISKTGFDIDGLAGKWVLDAGCGGGRYTRVSLLIM